MILLLLLACKTVTWTGDAAADVAVAPVVQEVEAMSPAPNPIPKPMPLLTINPVDLRVDQAMGALVYEPGSRVKSATYTEYWMDLDTALETLGGMPESKVSIRFQVVETKMRRVTPEPDLSSPDAGIRITEHHGFLVAPSSGMAPTP
jgi:hypothetical protein